MTRISYRASDIELLSRIMRAEAVGEGNFGMKLVGNVIINRCVSKCTPFKKQDTVYDVVYKKNAFEGITSPLFQGRATQTEKKMARDCIVYWRAYPAYDSLYFYAPGKGKSCKNDFWGVFVGKYKNHCFYKPKDPRKCGL